MLILLSSTAFASNEIYSVSNQSSYNHHVSDNSIYSNQIHNHTNNFEYNKDNSAINSNKSITSKKNTKLNHDSINTSIINYSKNNDINNRIISINSNDSTNSSTKIIKLLQIVWMKCMLVKLDKILTQVIVVLLKQQ